LVVGLILTAGLSWYVYQENPPEYTARSLVLLLPPEGKGEEAGANPFLQLGGLELTARVLVATYSGTAFQDEIAQRSPTAEVEVTMDDSTQGGVVAVDVKDRGEQNVMNLLGYVTGTVSQRLQGLQDEVGVEAANAVHSMLLAEDTHAKPDYQSLIRVLVLAVGGGVAGSVLLAILLDYVLKRRVGRARRRRLHSGKSGLHPGKDASPDVVGVMDGADREPAAREAGIVRMSHPMPARSAVPGKARLHRDQST